MPVITISRQYGSGGDAIAGRVCALLGYWYLDKWLLRQVAGEVGLSEEEVVDFSEDAYKARSFFQTLFGPRQRVVSTVSTRSRGAGGVTEKSEFTLDEAQCIDLIRVAVKHAYQRNNIVILGRGSQVILRDKPEVLHVRVEAPLMTRIANVQAVEDMTTGEARALIGNRDLAAQQYLERFFAVEWDDSSLYHLLINTGKCEVETAARIIVSAVECLVGETESTDVVAP
ncbi:AAA family ATPase [Chloroflexota bacterium]